MWTQKRKKKQYSKDDTGHRHARTQTPEVSALQTSARQGESKESCRERCALQQRQLSASSFRKQLLSNPDIGVWGQELGFPPDGRKQPTISKNKSLVLLHVLAELHIWTAYQPLDGGELAWRARGPGETRHLQTRCP